MEEFPQMPRQPIGDKKEEEKSFNAKSKENVEELKKRDNKKNWLKEKFDAWREQN
mgnify:CR=1 FL=1